MPEEVTILEDLSIIRVDSYGVVTQEDLIGSMREVSRIHRERGLTRVLVDATRETSLPSTFPLYEFGSDLARALRAVRFALVPAPDLKEDLTFLETVAINRGLEVEIFDSVPDAIQRLTQEGEGQGETQ